MGTILASELIDRAATLLFDTNNVQWSRLELLGYLNAGQRAIAIVSPTSTSLIAAVQLTAGARQRIPADGWMLLDVIRNMGTTGTVAGNAVRVISRRLLAAFQPAWLAATPSAVVSNYIFDLQDQTSFFVYPPSNGTNYLEINYSQAPSDLATETLAIGVSNALDDVLVNYMMFLACSKVVPYAPGPQIAAAYLGAFNQALGAKATAEQMNDPNFGLEKFSPSRPGGES